MNSRDLWKKRKNLSQREWRGILERLYDLFISVIPLVSINDIQLSLELASIGWLICCISSFLLINCSNPFESY